MTSDTSRAGKQAPADAAALEARFRQAMAHHQAGRLAEARDLYQGILQAQPQQPDVLHLLGLVFYQTGDHAAAADLIGRALEQRPDPVFFCNRGNALQALKQLDAAIASFDQALALKPDFAEAWSNRGNALRDCGRLDAALASYDKAIGLRPGSADAHFARGNALRALGRTEAAAASYANAIALRPAFADAHFNRGIALHDLKRFAEAVASYDRALALRPDYAAVYLNRGNALQDLKQLDAAIVSYDRAVALKPDYTEAHYNRGNALAKTQRPDAAIDSYRRAITLAPQHALAHYNLGHVYAEQGMAELAAAEYRACLAIEPDDRHGVRHLLAGLESAALPAAPSAAFLAELYRERSRDWDESRVYRGHRLVADATLQLLGTLDGREILDAGCGTGLVASALPASAARIDGLDLSADMLDKAREKGRYAHLYQGDLNAFMATHPRAYDAIVSAATLIHFSELAALFAAAATALRERGVFVFTVFPNEVDPDREVILHPSFNLAKGGCFAHSETYLRRVAQAAGFAVDLMQREVHEHDEHGRPVMCLVVGLRRA